MDPRRPQLTPETVPAIAKGGCIPLPSFGHYHRASGEKDLAGRPFYLSPLTAIGTGKTLLAPDFVDCHGHRVGEIQAA